MSFLRACNCRHLCIWTHCKAWVEVPIAFNTSTRAMTAPRSLHVALGETRRTTVTVAACTGPLLWRGAVFGKGFEHRRGWIGERVMQPAGIFNVDVWE